MKRPLKPGLQAENTWKKYSAAGMALAAAGAATHEAEAAILYTSGVNHTMIPSSVGTLALDIDQKNFNGQPGTPPFFFQTMDVPTSANFTMAFLSQGPYFSSYTRYVDADVAGTQTPTHTLVSKYDPGSSIGPTSLGWNHNWREYLERNDSGPWEGGAHAFVGLRITQNGTDYQYGWARIDYVDDTSLTLVDFAIEQDLNTAILAGDTGNGIVPEPSRTLLLGLGGAALRRRRQKS